MSDTRAVANPELAAIFQEPVTKRYGVVQFEEKPAKSNVRHEVLKIYMKRNYPSSLARLDLIDSLPAMHHFCVHPYFRHPTVNKKRNTRKAQGYLRYLMARRGYLNYVKRIEERNEYKDVIERMQYSFKMYIEELTLVYQKTVHIHFLHEILYIKNLQTYPFPKKWVILIAFFHGMPEYERLLAALRVITEYDGDRAPEFEAEMY